MRWECAPLKHLRLSRVQCCLLIVKLWGLLRLLLLDALRPLLLGEALSRVLLLVYWQTALDGLNVPPWALEIHPLELLLVELRGILRVWLLVPRRLSGRVRERLLQLV